MMKFKNLHLKIQHKLSTYKMSYCFYIVTVLYAISYGCTQYYKSILNLRTVLLLRFRGERKKEKSILARYLV